MNTRKITGAATLAAIAVLLSMIHFPILPSAPFLEYDAADIAIMIGTFTYGPILGLIITVIASIIQGYTVSAASGTMGVIMHIISTGTFALVGGTIYKYNRSLKGAVIGLIAGILAATAVMIPANLIVTPYFLGVPVSSVKDMLLPIIIPFNLIKYSINATLCFLIYKRLRLLITFISDKFNERKIEDKKKEDTLDDNM